MRRGLSAMTNLGEGMVGGHARRFDPWLGEPGLSWVVTTMPGHAWEQAEADPRRRPGSWSAGCGTFLRPSWQATPGACASLAAAGGGLARDAAAGIGEVTAGSVPG
jgi:hypothetical protein